MIEPTLERERELLQQADVVIALDEVGRGALAGPVAVGAAVVDAAVLRTDIPSGLRDSKLIPERRRPEAARRAEEWVRASGVGWAEAGDVDAQGIIRALGLAASRAILSVAATIDPGSRVVVLLDGNHDYVSAVHPTPLLVRTAIKADRDCAAVSAASVIAKVARDQLMIAAHTQYPPYSWERNKGYASAEHRAAIREWGLSPLHRSSWAITDAPALF